jgi:hypothetical protein
MSKLFKTTVKKGSKKAFAKIRSFGKEIEYKKEMKKEIGDFVVDRIQRVTRSGKDPGRKSFKSLKKSTKMMRKSIAKYNKTHPLFKVPRSNLTITGQLVDSVSYVFKGKVIDIRPRGIHSAYKGKPGKNRGGWDNGEGKSNEEIAKNLLDQGRVFIGLDDVAKERINRILSKWARRLLRLK